MRLQFSDGDVLIIFYYLIQVRVIWKQRTSIEELPPLN